jgi:hypothetical protein
MTVSADELFIFAGAGVSRSVPACLPTFDALRDEILNQLGPDPLKWAAVLGGVGLLVPRITIPDTQAGKVDELLSDRFAFDKGRPQARVGRDRLAGTRGLIMTSS